MLCPSCIVGLLPRRAKPVKSSRKVPLEVASSCPRPQTSPLQPLLAAEGVDGARKLPLGVLDLHSRLQTSELQLGSAGEPVKFIEEVPPAAANLPSRLETTQIQLSKAAEGFDKTESGSADESIAFVGKGSPLAGDLHSKPQPNQIRLSAVKDAAEEQPSRALEPIKTPGSLPPRHSRLRPIQPPTRAEFANGQSAGEPIKSAIITPPGTSDLHSRPHTSQIQSLTSAEGADKGHSGKASEPVKCAVEVPPGAFAMRSPPQTSLTPPSVSAEDADERLSLRVDEPNKSAVGVLPFVEDLPSLLETSPTQLSTALEGEHQSGSEGGPIESTDLGGADERQAGSATEPIKSGVEVQIGADDLHSRPEPRQLEPSMVAKVGDGKQSGSAGEPINSAIEVQLGVENLRSRPQKSYFQPSRAAEGADEPVISVVEVPFVACDLETIESVVVEVPGAGDLYSPHLTRRVEPSIAEEGADDRQAGCAGEPIKSVVEEPRGARDFHCRPQALQIQPDIAEEDGDERQSARAGEPIKYVMEMLPCVEDLYSLLETSSIQLSTAQEGEHQSGSEGGPIESTGDLPAGQEDLHSRLQTIHNQQSQTSETQPSLGGADERQAGSAAEPIKSGVEVQLGVGDLHSRPQPLQIQPSMEAESVDGKQSGSVGESINSAVDVEIGGEDLRSRHQTSQIWPSRAAEGADEPVISAVDVPPAASDLQIIESVVEEIPLASVLHSAHQTRQVQPSIAEEDADDRRTGCAGEPVQSVSEEPRGARDLHSRPQTPQIQPSIAADYAGERKSARAGAPIKSVVEESTRTGDLYSRPQAHQTQPSIAEAGVEETQSARAGEPIKSLVEKPSGVGDLHSQPRTRLYLPPIASKRADERQSGSAVENGGTKLIDVVGAASQQPSAAFGRLSPRKTKEQNLVEVWLMLRSSMKVTQFRDICISKVKRARERLAMIAAMEKVVAADAARERREEAKKEQLADRARHKQWFKEVGIQIQDEVAFVVDSQSDVDALRQEISSLQSRMANGTELLPCIEEEDEHVSTAVDLEISKLAYAERRSIAVKVHEERNLRDLERLSTQVLEYKHQMDLLALEVREAEVELQAIESASDVGTSSSSRAGQNGVRSVFEEASSPHCRGTSVEGVGLGQWLSAQRMVPTAPILSDDCFAQSSPSGGVRGRKPVLKRQNSIVTDPGSELGFRGTPISLDFAMIRAQARDSVKAEAAAQAAQAAQVARDARIVELRQRIAMATARQLVAAEKELEFQARLSCAEQEASEAQRNQQQTSREISEAENVLLTFPVTSQVEELRRGIVFVEARQHTLRESISENLRKLQDALWSDRQGLEQCRVTSEEARLFLSSASAEEDVVQARELVADCEASERLLEDAVRSLSEELLRLMAILEQAGLCSGS